MAQPAQTPFLANASDDWEDPDPPQGLTGDDLKEARQKILKHIQGLREHYEGECSPRTFWEDMYLQVRPANWHSLQPFREGKMELKAWKDLITAKGFQLPDGRGVRLAKQMVNFFHVPDRYPGSQITGAGHSSVPQGQVTGNMAQGPETPSNGQQDPTVQENQPVQQGTPSAQRSSHENRSDKIHQPQAHQSPIQQENTRSEDSDAARFRGPRLSAVGKMLIGREKFSAAMDQDLNSILDTYEHVSDLQGCTDEEKARGLALVLDGVALKFFVQNMRNVYTFAEARRKLLENYTSEEQRTRCFSEFQGMRLSTECRQADDDASERAVFLKAAEKLRNLQRLLDQAYDSDQFLRDQLILMADVPDIRRSFAVQRVTTAAAAQERISTFLSMEPGSARRAHNFDQGPSAFVGEETDEEGENYFGTDRRFYPKRKNFRGRRPSRSAKKKIKCWVCGGEHRARDAHGQDEVKRAIDARKANSRTAFFSAEEVEDITAMFGDDEGEPHEEDSAVSNFAETVSSLSYAATTTMANAAFLHVNQCYESDGHVPGGADKPELTAFLEECALRCRTKDDVFRGVLIDTGCNLRSTISTRELKRYMSTYDTVPEIIWKKSGSIRGISGVIECLGKTRLPVPFPQLGVVLEFEFFIVEGQQPALLCLRDMKEAGIDISLQNDTVTVAGVGRNQKLAVQNYQLWHRWSKTDLQDSECLYTVAEAEKLHRSFGHPSTQKLAAMLEKADPAEVSSLRKMLDDIRRQCITCQTLSQKPQRYRLAATDPEACFNSEILCDIMYIRKKPVLHIVDEATKLTAAAFLKSVSAESVWSMLRRLWICTYVGPPDLLKVDRGSQFASKFFFNNAEEAGIEVQVAPTECPTELSTVERYHGPLRAAFERIRSSTKMDDEDALSYAVYTVNCTVGPEGQVPMLLVFGALPRPARQVPAPTQLERAKAMERAREDVARIHAKNRVRVGLKYKGPFAGERADLSELRSGDRCLVYRPGEKKWVQYDFLNVERETVTVRNPRTGSRSLFRSTVVKPCPENAIDDCVADAMMGEQTSGAVLGDKSSVDFTEARKEELDGLLKSNVFRVVDVSEMNPSDRLFKSRFVDAVKQNGRLKSRLVACAFQDEEATKIATRSPTVSRCATRVALSFAASAVRRGRKVYVRDITQAYTQADEDLKRMVYLEPPVEMGLPEGKVLLCIRPLYGVPEAGLFWYSTYSSYHTDDLQMLRSRVDPCLFVRHEDDGTSVVLLQVDDSFGFGPKGFLDSEEEHVQKFKCKPRTMLGEGETSFNGHTIVLEKDGCIAVHQTSHLAGVNMAEDLEGMISSRASLQYIGTCTRPDLAGPVQCLATELAKPDAPSKQACNTLRSLVNIASESSDVGLKFVPLDEERLEVVVVTDASFAREPDLKSRLGYVIALTDGSGRANIVDWGSKRSPRVCRSVMASELLGLVAGFDCAYTVREMVAEIRGVKPQDIPLRAGVDSKTVFDAVTRRAITLEKRLQIDMFALKEAQDNGDMQELFWFPREYNFADPLTQREYVRGSALCRLMQTNTLELPASGTYFICEPKKKA